MNDFLKILLLFFFRTHFSRMLDSVKGFMTSAKSSMIYEGKYGTRISSRGEPFTNSLNRANFAAADDDETSFFISLKLQLTISHSKRREWVGIL